MLMDEIKLWAVDGSNGAVPVAAVAGMESERLLEDTLVNNPDMLMPGLTLVGRQTPTGGGALDLLGIDDDGRLVVFELKRGTLSRDAVAQVIDYASYLESMPDGELASYISERSGLHGVAKIDDFEEWYDAKSEGQGLSGLKPVRMVLVGLGVDATTNRMAQFLASGGMDFSLLTFHGYAYDDKTLLARQVQVEAADHEGTARPPSVLSGWERRELLDARVREHANEWPEAQNLWDAILGMFRKNLRGPAEVARRGGGEWGKRRLNFSMPAEKGMLGKSGNFAAIQLGPFAPHPELVSAIFFSHVVGLCFEKFTELRREFPGLTWPPNSPHREQRASEIRFSIKSLTEWETHKDSLAVITRSIYEVYYASEDEE